MRLTDFFRAPQVVRDGEFSQLDEAGGEEKATLAFCQTIAFLRIANANPRVSCVITRAELAADCSATGLVVSEDPRLDFFRLYNRMGKLGLAPSGPEPGIGECCNIHAAAVVSPKARIGKHVTIGAFAVIEGNCVIGDETHIGPGTIIGADGLQTVMETDGRSLFIPHQGGVRIGPGVVILAGTVVARSLYRAYTELGDSTQVGILSNIGHGVRSGSNCVISGNCLIAGRVRLGKGVRIGASASIAQGLVIGDGAQIRMGSVVVADVGCGETVSGNFALRHAITLRRYLEARG